MSDEKRHKLLTDLDKMASPLWQYDEGVVIGSRKTEMIYLFGVNNLEDTMFNIETLRSHFESTTNPTIISTGDPLRITCFKVEAAIPAYTVQNMKTYRNKYINPDYSFSYHLDKNWEISLPKLFPGTDEEENRKWWSIGLADPFKLIFKTGNGNWYYVISKKHGKRTEDYKVKLAQGRLEALKALLNNEDYLEEIEECIQKKTMELGNQKVISFLREYSDNLLKTTKQQKNMDKDIRELVDSEIDDIEIYTNFLDSPL